MVGGEAVEIEGVRRGREAGPERTGGAVGSKLVVILLLNGHDKALCSGSGRLVVWSWVWVWTVFLCLFMMVIGTLNTFSVNKNKLLSHVWQSEEMWWPLGAAVAVDAKVEIAIAKNMHPSSQRFILAPRRATTRDGAIFA